jgi:hypothetical protein
MDLPWTEIMFIDQKAEVITQSVNGMFEASVRRGTRIDGYRVKVLVDLVIGNLLRELAEGQCNNGNASDIINPIEGEGPIFVEWVPQNFLFEGESVIFHLTGGFKIGNTLWKK